MRYIQLLLALLLSLGLLDITSNTLAATTAPLTTIELETPVHFLAPDGSDLLVEAGTYTVEPAEEWIRLMSGERHDAVLIEATKSTHELELEQSMGLSVPGETEEESDLHHVTLLLPDGQSLDATGTYSGIRHRGFLQKTFNNVKKKTRQAYRKAKSTARKTISTAKGTVRKAKGRVKKGVQSAKKAALHAKRHVEKGAKISAIKITMEVMKRSIEKTNQDKRHFLKKINEANKKKQQIIQKLKDKNLPRLAKERLKQKLKNLEDTNQKLMFELQKVATRVTQAEQALSSVMKKMNDMQKAIIKNM